jgi:hypothetical protein
MTYHERRLPHWDVVGQPLFVTFRLHGSLPAGRLFAPDTVTNGKAFVAMDRLLDCAATGPRHLSNPAIAAVVVSCLCAMANDDSTGICCIPLWSCRIMCICW